MGSKNLKDLTEKNLCKIKKNIEEAFEYFRENYDNWHACHKLIFYKTLTGDEEATLDSLLKPKIEFNVLEAYISRLRGEFSKQLPSIEVSPDCEASVDADLTSFLEGHLRHVFYEANKNNCEYDAYTHTMAGGFDVFKVWTEYVNDRSFKQAIKFGRVFDPTICGFDPLAKESHKGDGNFCFELYPKTKEAFEEEFPDIDLSEISYSGTLNGMSWSYHNQKNNKIILLADFYEKKTRKEKVRMLNTGQVLNENEYEEFMIRKRRETLPIENVLNVVDERITNITYIVRYILIENQIIEYEETDFKHLPLVFVDGNSVTFKEDGSSCSRQYTRSYIHNAIGAQKLKNYAGQTLAHGMENILQSKIKIPIEGLPNQAQYLEPYRNPQLMALCVYNQFKDNDPNVRLDSPQAMDMPATPPEVVNAFAGADSVIQSTLGSYDASLGINNNQLSGIAVVEAATQSNAAAMPYVVSIMHALTRVAEIYIDLIPKYYVTPRSIPIIDSEGKKTYVEVNQKDKQSLCLFYDSNLFNVKVEPGVNYAIQKSKALNQIIAIVQALPNSTFSQLITNDGLPILLDNLEIRGIDQLKNVAEKFIEQQKIMQQQAQQMAQAQYMNNPEVIAAQAYNKKIMLDAQNNNVKNQLKAAEIAVDERKVNNEEIKTLAKLEESKIDMARQIRKDTNEQTKDAVNLAIKVAAIASKQKAP